VQIVKTKKAFQFLFFMLKIETKQNKTKQNKTKHNKTTHNKKSKPLKN
jgi:hypothetical protein